MRDASSDPIRVGAIGCGNISVAYLTNAPLFRGIDVVACADLDFERAKERARQYDLRASTVEELLADPEVDLVLNLTVPSAHFGVSHAALSAGKHVFTEKPIATSLSDGRRLVEEAARRGLMIGSAPDTFLGAAGRRTRQLVDAGAIGKCVIGTAFMFGHGMEHKHPNPQFYYQPGAGPVLDMGPYYLTMLVNLLGPVASVTALTSRGQEERLITAEGPFKNTKFAVGTPTSALSLLEFRSGAVVTFGASWDVYKHSNQPIELHGTEGSLRLPDPDWFGGDVLLSQRGADWSIFESEAAPFGAKNFPYAEPNRANYRCIGLADLARAVINAGVARASGALALHVLDAMEAILRSGAAKETVRLSTTVDRPPALTEEDAASLRRPV